MLRATNSPAANAYHVPCQARTPQSERRGGLGVLGLVFTLSRHHTKKTPKMPEMVMSFPFVPHSQKKTPPTLLRSEGDDVSGIVAAKVSGSESAPMHWC
eukprot:3340827-Rhodomonas_salina.2